MKIGSLTWVISGGHIPATSTGDEPLHTSRDEIAILNTHSKDAEIEIKIYYTDRDPVGPYKVQVAAQRVRVIRFSDLIDPEPIMLDVDFGAVVISSVPVVVQFARVDTSKGNLAISIMPAVQA